MYADVLSVIPSNTTIVVPLPANDETVASAAAGTTSASDVINAVTASEPAVPSAPG